MFHNVERGSCYWQAAYVLSSSPTGLTVPALETPNSLPSLTGLRLSLQFRPEKHIPMCQIIEQPRLSPINLQRIRATPPGGGWRDLPNELVPNCHKFGFTGYSDVYGRLRWDTPAPAMTTRCISYSNGRFGHPQQDRAISVREAACLQTFPADFVFTGSLNAQARQVGNAVPPLLAQRFGERVAGHAVGSTNDSRSSGSGRI